MFETTDIGAQKLLDSHLKDKLIFVYIGSQVRINRYTTRYLDTNDY